MCVFVLFAAAQTLVSVQIVGSSQVFFSREEGFVCSKTSASINPWRVVATSESPSKRPWYIAWNWDTQIRLTERSELNAIFDSLLFVKLDWKNDSETAGRHLDAHNDVYTYAVADPDLELGGGGGRSSFTCPVGHFPFSHFFFFYPK